MLPKISATTSVINFGNTFKNKNFSNRKNQLFSIFEHSILRVLGGIEAPRTEISVGGRSNQFFKNIYNCIYSHMASPDDVICAFSNIFSMYDLISGAFYDNYRGFR